MSATACIGLNTPRWTLLVADSGRDLWRLGEGDTRRELVNGEVRELAAVGGVHVRVTGRIYRRLTVYVDASSCTSRTASLTNRQHRRCAASTTRTITKDTPYVVASGSCCSFDFVSLRNGIEADVSETFTGAGFASCLCLNLCRL